MSTPVEHKDCRSFLEARSLETGVEAWAIDTDPGGPYESFTCPHSVTYWLVPTADQRRRWEEEETP